MAGDQQEFHAIYTEYRPKIVGYLRRLVGEAEAEDVAQEVFVKVSRSLDGFRGDSSLSTWLYRIATNAAMDHLRKPASRQAANTPAGLDDDSSDSKNAIPDEERTVLDTRLIRKDMNECIAGIEDGMPQNKRVVLVLSGLER